MQNVDKLKNPIKRKSGEEKAKKCGKKAAAVSASSGQSLSDSELDRRGAEGIDERIPGFMHCMLGGSGSDSSDVSPVRKICTMKCGERGWFFFCPLMFIRQYHLILVV